MKAQGGTTIFALLCIVVWLACHFVVAIAVLAISVLLFLALKYIISLYRNYSVSKHQKNKSTNKLHPIKNNCGFAGNTSVDNLNANDTDNWEYHHLQNSESCLQMSANNLHQNGCLKEEIDYINQVIQRYEACGLSCESWYELLQNRHKEYELAVNCKFVISQIVLGLLQNAILREKIISNSDGSNIVKRPSQSNKTEVQTVLTKNDDIIEIKHLQEWDLVKNFHLREKANTIHQMGYFDDEIDFIKDIIQSYKLSDFAYKYWNILLKKRMVEYTQLQRDSRHMLSQIIDGLFLNALNREYKQKIGNKDNANCQISDVEKDNRSKECTPKELIAINNNDVKINSIEEVPYWEHTYVYSADYLQNANQQQKLFYEHFKTQFCKGNYLDVKGNSNYAFILMFDLADDCKKHEDTELLKKQLDRLAKNYPVTARYVSQTLLKATIAIHLKEVETDLLSFDKSNGQLCRWVNSKEVIEIQGIKLTRGNFYIGECFLLPDDIIAKNSFWADRHKGAYIYGPVLNPNLVVISITMLNTPFCSYKDMSPSWRYEYLMWLSGKKEASEVSVEILLFYLYGCEIRMFINPQTKDFERKSILSDIVQLYKFLDTSSIVLEKKYMILENLRDFIDNSIAKYYYKESLIEIKGLFKHNQLYQDRFISQMLSGGKIPSSEEAFNIACEIFNIKQLTSDECILIAKQYFTEHFTELLYDENSISFNRNSRSKSVSWQYNRWNDCYFCPEKTDLTYKIEDMPECVYPIRDAIERCCWNIETIFRRYNRAREHFDGKETITAIMLLPNETNIKVLPKVQNLITRIGNEMLTNKYLIKPIDWLLDLWEYERKNEKSIHKEYVDSIIGGLKRIGFDIVPDYEIDKKRFNFGDVCVIYRNEEQHSVKLTAEYEISDLFIKLAAQIINTDKVTDEDFVHIEQYLQSYDNSIGNHLHLMAAIRWRLFSKKQTIDKQIKNAIEILTNEQKKSMGDALVGLTCFNGNISPKRIEGVKKALQLLGIDTGNIHSQIHRLLTDNDGFAIIEKKSDAVEFTINNGQLSTEQCGTSHITINQTKLRTLEQQTKVAQEILSEIFAEEKSAEYKEDIAVNNISNMWMDMLKLLFTKETWKRIEIENICKKQGLMLGAVLEQINDYAYEKVDDAVVEDDGENIYVTLDYKKLLI